MIATRDTLGIGLYSPEEAAFYARVQTRLLKRWMFDQKSAVITPQVADQDEVKTVTFRDMIQALAIRDIRHSFGLPLQKIREAVEFVRDRYGIQYPFAMQHTTYLVSDQRHKGHGNIVIRIPGLSDADDEQFVQASGDGKANLLIKEAAELYLEELRYDSGGYADEYRPMTSEDDSILLTPDRRFGEPIVESCGYTVQTLRDAVISEGSIEAAAEEFGVSVASVKLAYRYYDHLLNSAG
jgi:uncharacterized protein (DUF433 family)